MSKTMEMNVWQGFEAARERWGLFLDFDGTLADIVPVPEDARPREGVVELLSRLDSELGAVVVVSGRSAHQLLQWLGSGIEIWGLHGAQRVDAGSVVLDESVRPFVTAIARARDEAEAALSEEEGVIVEDKQASVALHYRSAQDPRAARARVERVGRELAARHGLKTAGGRQVLELRPPVELSKATVVSRRARELDLMAVIYVGDDRVDLPSFDALDLLASEGIETLRVAVASDEAPAELLERADLKLNGPAEVVRWLRDLVS